jgi:translation elongation factor EF-Ts
MHCTIENIRKMREDTGMGLMECKRILQKSDIHDAICEATTVEDLKEQMLHLLNLIR